MRTRRRKPTHPGAILRLEFLEPMELTQRQLAEHMGYEVKTINRLVNERTRVTPALALSLSKALGTTPEFWLNLQNALDLWRAPAPDHGLLVAE